RPRSGSGSPPTSPHLPPASVRPRDGPSAYHRSVSAKRGVRSSGDDRLLRAAAVQLTTTADRDRNIQAAGALVSRAAAAGAQLVVLPEKWHHIDDPARMKAAAEPLDGPSLEAARGWARRHRIALVAGSVVERVE